MRLTPPEIYIDEDEGFTSEKDIFKYKEFGERLANVVRNIDQPLVIALDGPWGSGKSTFIKQWAGLLRQLGGPVIHFDAFGNDHQEDAFLALSAEIYALAEQAFGKQKSAASDYLAKAKKAGKVLLPGIARVAVRAASAGLVNIDDIKDGSEATKAAFEAFGKESEAWVEAIVSDRLQSAAEDRAALEAFRDTLSSLASRLCEGEATKPEADPEARSDFPLVVVVDELDRCRPPFALSVIERIKHLFSVDGVCFVLVTDLRQLEMAIQGAYGSSVNAQTYLEKFYQARVMLPERGPHRLSTRRRYVSHLWQTFGFAFGFEHVNRRTEQEIAILAEVHELPLRTIGHVMTNLAFASSASTTLDDDALPVLVGLCVMRHKAPDLYGKARLGILTWDETKAFVFPATRTAIYQSGFRHDSGDVDSLMKLWRFASVGNLSPEFQKELEGSLPHRKGFLSSMTVLIDDLNAT